MRVLVGYIAATAASFNTVLFTATAVRGCGGRYGPLPAAEAARLAGLSGEKVSPSI